MTPEVVQETITKISENTGRECDHNSQIVELSTHMHTGCYRSI